MLPVRLANGTLTCLVCPLAKFFCLHDACVVLDVSYLFCTQQVFTTRVFVAGVHRSRDSFSPNMLAERV